VRNIAFDSGLLQCTTLDVPVISVGNLTVGGTGKTPLVELITGHLVRRGRRVAVVSRGYGRRSSGVVVVSDNGSVLADARSGGDEPVQIARKFPSVSVVVGERRSEAARVAVSRCGADVIILDDGYQHRYLHRDLDIVVLDARTDIRRIPLLPAGTRREWLSALRRADLVGFSRAETGADPAWAGAVPSGRERHTFSYRTVPKSFGSLAGGSAFDIAALKSMTLFAFSGIGDHASFVQTMRTAGLTIRGDLRMRDHHTFTEGDMDRIFAAASDAGATGCLTTEKDMVRLIADPALVARIKRALPVLYATVAVEVIRGSEHLESAIGRAVSGRRSQ
jgi:tetraacyldisaccharide 4'-kinase